MNLRSKKKKPHFSGQEQNLPLKPAASKGDNFVKIKIETLKDRSTT